MSHRVLLYRGHSTVESARARMGWHLPLDRTERCLTRGQCALARRHFATAEALLTEAPAPDPHSSHIQMYPALALFEPPPERPFDIPLPASLRRRRRRHRLARARRLADAGRFEDVADTLAVQPDVLDEPGARELLERARRRAVQAVTAALERAEPRERRALLLRRYESENDLADRDAAYRTLEAWLAAHAEAGSPSSETPVAEAAARRLAEIDVDRGDYERALQHCATSRAVRPARETHGVEAVALLGLGRKRPARHRFEDFLADALFPIDASVARALESSA